MQQFLHTIAREFQYFKQNPKMSEIYLPTINGNKDLSGFNIFWATLWANNRNLKGDYTTLSFIEENELKWEENASKIYFLNYHWSNTMTFIAQDVKKYIPNFEMSDENIQLLKNIFEEGKINSFPTERKEEIKKDFGEIYEINFGKSILNYRKIEAIPNEYISGIKQNPIQFQEKELKTDLEDREDRKYENFNEALQDFFFCLITYGKANMKLFKQFELHQLPSGIQMFIDIQNNYHIGKSLQLQKNEESLMTNGFKILRLGG